MVACVAKRLDHKIWGQIDGAAEVDVGSGYQSYIHMIPSCMMSNTLGVVGFAVLHENHLLGNPWSKKSCISDTIS